MPEKHLPQGTEIVCPHCFQVMMIAKHTVVAPARIGPDNFHQVGFRGARGDRSVCPYDGTPFVRQRHEETEKHRMNPDYLPEAQIHTREGWK